MYPKLNILATAVPQVVSIQDAIAAKVPKFRDTVKTLKQKHGSKVIGNCTLNQAYGGLRRVTCVTYETSDVDPLSGVRVRGLPISECHTVLPKPPGSDYPYVEAMFWLLLTGDVPSPDQTVAFRDHLASLATIPPHVEVLLDNFPDEMHPMTKLSSALLALQPESKMTRSYREGTSRADLWESCLSDVLRIVAVIPFLAARIYRGLTGATSASGGQNDNAKKVETPDLAKRFALDMGFDSESMFELIRLYLTTHMDMGGGSASCFATRVVGATLSDPYLAWTAGVNGLAGPLHGAANQEVLRWLRSVHTWLDGEEATDDKLREFCWKTLKAGRVIPGYGHTTLCKTDARFFMQRAFGEKHLPGDDLCELVRRLYRVVPGVLTEHGKARNPWPNVDAHSGALLHGLGLRSAEFQAVMFAVSRAMGPLSNLVWDRVLVLPVVRPMTVTTAWLEQQMEGHMENVESE